MKPFAVLVSAAAFFLALSCATPPAKSAMPSAKSAAPSPALQVAAPAAAPISTPAAPTTPAATPAAASGSPAVVPALDIYAELKPYAAASKNCLGVLRQALTFESEGKWLSAFKAISDFDAATADPYALAMKTSIVLKGAVRTDMDRAFGLVDLLAGQDLQTLRNTEGDYPPIAFDPAALADAQAAKGTAAPGILSKELGDYYYDVLARFSGKWEQSDEEILAKVAENYGKAYTAGIYDLASLLGQAETLVRLNRADESEPIYAAAIRLDPASAKVHYSYAMSLAYRGKKPEAIIETDKAITDYGEDPERINAIALGARTAAELGDDAKLQSYYALVDKAYPDSPTPGILRHAISVETGNKAAAAAAADSLIVPYGSNPEVVRTLISTWFSAGEGATARGFLERNISTSVDGMTVGTLNFYLAVLLIQDLSIEADRTAALKALDAAQAAFTVTLNPDNQVFGVIASIRQSLQPAAPPADSGDGSAAK